MDTFSKAYTLLNKGQKQAVDTIEGPVMVVAGPGTGKTQVLALRIAHILEKTDVGADAVLCLTFTRSGVHAMRDRLERYIGPEARKVTIATFHSFAGDIVESYYPLLDFDTPPELLDDTKAVLLVDELLQTHTWEHIRPRTNPAYYFSDLRHLISILKRERLTPAVFLVEVEKEIASLLEDPESISSRGASKGSLKKEIEKKIESLERTKEVVSFYRMYEQLKKERALMDYDDVLEYAVRLVEESEEVRADIREKYQYVLIDEHQDSSGVQNAFLKAVWKDTERPNIFVVGDDRQLIYGFSGASLSYFEEFKMLFGKAACITLSDNYRSTSQILALADDMLVSSVSKEPLVSATGSGDPIGLYEYSYERDELLGAATYFETRIAQGASPLSCALLVPKNRHVKMARALFRERGIPVVAEGGSSFFEESDSKTLIRILRILTDPYNSVLLAESMLDSTSNIVPFDVHTFLYAQKGKNFSIETMQYWEGGGKGLFAGQSAMYIWATKLREWIDIQPKKTIAELISLIGNEVLLNQPQSHESLLRRIEIVRSLLHVCMMWQERKSGTTLIEFLSYLTRLESYGQDIPIASFSGTSGVSIMTLHKSKGLEFDTVWIAHMNEETVMAQKRSAFTLPQAITDRLEARNRATATRELYVAITRAKKHCIISYAANTYDGRPRSLSDIIIDLPKTHIVSKSAAETEQELLERDPTLFSGKSTILPIEPILSEIQTFTANTYSATKISVTLLNNFFECPWKWYFRNFLKIPEIKGVSLALGSAVHSTIEYILKSKQKPEKQFLITYIDTQLEKEGIYDTQERLRLLEDAEKAVTQWIDGYYSELAEDRLSERPIQTRDALFPHLHFFGKIDLTERFEDGSIVVTDFKTGKLKRASEIEKRSEDGRLSGLLRQLAMYSYLIEHAEQREVSRSRLLFVEEIKKEKNALYETTISREHIELLIRDIQEYDEALKTGSWITRTCQHVGYAGHTQCEYCALIKKIKTPNLKIGE